MLFVTFIIVLMTLITSSSAAQEKSYQIVDDLIGFARTLVQEKKIDEAIQTVTKHLDSFPDNYFEITSFLWRLHIQAGDLPKAMDTWRYGHSKGCFYELAALRQFYGNLSDQPGFTQLVNEDNRLKKQVQSKSKATYEIQLPKEYSKGNQYPLFIALHGGSETIDQAKKMWQSDLLSSRYITAYIQSSQVFTSKGFSWHADYQRGRRDIQSILKKIIRKYPVDTSRIITAGYSAGGMMAIDLVVNDVIPSDQFIAVCPSKIQSLNSEILAAAGRAAKKGTIITGELDPMLADQESMREKFRESGIQVRCLINPGTGRGTPDGFSGLLDDILKEKHLISDIMAGEIKTNGIGHAISRYHNLKADHPEAYYFAPGQLYFTAYAFLKDGNREAACKLLELNSAEYPDFRHFEHQISRAVLTKTEQELMEWYAQMKAQGDEDFQFQENVLNTLGYKLLQSDASEEAIQVFKLNINAFPDSANAYDSLGEALMAVNKNDEAAVIYEKSLHLNPFNFNATSQLTRCQPAWHTKIHSRAASQLMEIGFASDTDPAPAVPDISGCYQSMAGFPEARIMKSENRWILYASGLAGIPLTPVSSHEVKINGSPNVLAFDTDENGNVSGFRFQQGQSEMVYTKMSEGDLKELEVIRVTDGIYRMSSHMIAKSNSFAVIDGEDLLMIDSGQIADGAELKQQLSLLSPHPVQYILNTHLDLDHRDGNGLLGDSARIITGCTLNDHVIENTIRKPDRNESGKIGKNFPEMYVMKFHDRDIWLISNPGIHTQCDMLIYIPDRSVLFMGDLLLPQSFPSVFLTIGAYMEFLEKVVNTFPADTLFLAGHGKDCSMEDLKEYKSMLEKTIQRIRTEKDAGKSVEAIKSESPLKQWDSYCEFIPYLNTYYWIEAIYASYQ